MRTLPCRTSWISSVADARHLAELARHEGVSEAVDDLAGVLDLVFVQTLEGFATELLSVDELANDGFIAQAPLGYLGAIRAALLIVLDDPGTRDVAGVRLLVRR
jgi:hypothetical protein